MLSSATSRHWDAGQRLVITLMFLHNYSGFGYRSVHVMWLRILLVAGLLGYCGMPAAWAAEPSVAGEEGQEKASATYKLGVFPYLTPLRMEAIYAPVGAALSRAISDPVQFRTASRFELFFAKLKAQDYDIALIQPFWYGPAVDQFGYLPLARMEEPFTSLIMVLDESPLRSPEDLRGESVATPPAFVPVTRMASRALEEIDIVPGRDVELKAYKSVDSCFQQVLIGSASACVSPPFAPPVIEEKLKVKLRVLMQTPGIPNLTFVVHSRVPAEVRSRFQQAILSWANSDEGRILLQAIKTRGFVAADDAEYDVVRALVKETQQP